MLLNIFGWFFIVFGVILAIVFTTPLNFGGILCSFLFALFGFSLTTKFSSLLKTKKINLNKGLRFIFSIALFIAAGLSANMATSATITEAQQQVTTENNKQVEQESTEKTKEEPENDSLDYDKINYLTMANEVAKAYLGEDASVSAWNYKDWRLDGLTYVTSTIEKDGYKDEEFRMRFCYDKLTFFSVGGEKLVSDIDTEMAWMDKYAGDNSENFK